MIEEYAIWLAAVLQMFVNMDQVGSPAVSPYMFRNV